jgi:SAM-dependent methyltransferase
VSARPGLAPAAPPAAVERFYDDFSSRLLRDWVEGNRRVELQFRFLREALPASLGSVLVVGCGNGAVARHLARAVALRARVLALDLSGANVAVAGRVFGHPRVEFRKADIIRDAVEGPWDAIVMPDVYEHIPAADRPAVHARLAALLAPRGRLLLTLPSPGHQEWLRRRGDEMQVVDESVELADLLALADDVGGTLACYNRVSVWRTDDYVHAVIERGDPAPRDVGPLDAVPLKGQAPPSAWSRTTAARLWASAARALRRLRARRA